MVKLPYGHRDGKLHYITTVESGLGCGCVCPQCGGSLIAKHGTERVPHFAHEDSRDCKGAGEFAVQQLVLELLGKDAVLELPASSDMVGGNQVDVIPVERVSVISAQTLQSTDLLRPCIQIEVLDSNGDREEIVMELNFGSKSENSESQHSTVVEINFSQLGSDYSVDVIKAALLENTKCLRWKKRLKADLAADKLREKLSFDGVVTTEEERRRLLGAAQRKFENGVGTDGFPGDTYGKPGGIGDSEDYPPRQSPPQFYRYETIPYRCDECGTAGLQLGEMVIARTGDGSGLCLHCTKKRWC